MYKELLDLSRIPKHVAIIMDGNGRWAKARGLARSMGHQQGVETVRNIATTASNLGIKYLTLYTFSTENWNRPSNEVATLMSLILTSLQEELFDKNNARCRIIGDITRLPKEVQISLLRLQEHTSKYNGMTMVLALNYSSRWELTETTKRIVRQVKENLLTEADVTPEVIDHELATSFMPAPELLIRTGGELRLSNYLLWQSAYTELYFCDTFWPDFDNEEFFKALVEYQHRERRFGKTSEQILTEQ